MTKNLLLLQAHTPNHGQDAPRGLIGGRKKSLVEMILRMPTETWIALTGGLIMSLPILVRSANGCYSEDRSD